MHTQYDNFFKDAVTTEPRNVEQQRAAMCHADDELAFRDETTEARTRSSVADKKLPRDKHICGGVQTPECVDRTLIKKLKN